MTTVKTQLWKTSNEPVPLNGVKIEGQIHSFCARLSVTQTYTTPKASKLSDFEFKFPLYDLGSVITDFDVSIAGKTIKSSVQKRDAVDKKYKEATSNSFQPYVELNCTDIFICHVKQVAPEVTVAIRISFIRDLLLDGDSLALSIPPILSPRSYHHESTTLLSSKDLKEFPLSMEIDLNMFCPISAVRSPVHPIHFERNGDSSGRLTFTQGSGPVSDTDVTLLIDFAQPLKDVLPACFVESSEQEGPGHTAVMVSMIPQFDFPEPQLDDDEDMAQEILFVVDNLHPPPPVEYVQKALKVAIDHLKDKPQVSFNIILAGTSLFQNRSKSVTPQTIKEAESWLGSFQWDFLGGKSVISSKWTLLELFKKVYEYDVVSESTPRTIMLISNACLSRANPLLGFVNENDSNFRIFPISLGNNSNYYVLNTLAKLTSGYLECAFKCQGVSNEDFLLEVGKRVEAQMHRILEPAFKDVTMDWGSLSDQIVFTHPPSFWNRDLVSIFGLLPSPPSSSIAIKVTARSPYEANTGASSNGSGDEGVSTREIGACLNPIVVKGQGSVHLRGIWDRYTQLINDSEEAEEESEEDAKTLRADADNLALMFSFSTSNTSFWAKEKNGQCAVLLASKTDFEGASIPTLKYSAQEILKLQPLNTQMPEGLNLALPPALFIDSVGVSPDAKSRDRSGGKGRGKKQQRGAGGGGTKQRSSKLEVQTIWNTGATPSSPGAPAPLSSAEIARNDELFREINSLLSKLTRDNYRNIIDKLLAKKAMITSDDVLAMLAKIVFEKAVSAPIFAELYADLCCTLCDPPKTLPPVHQNFRRHLLEKCQREFERKATVLTPVETPTEEHERARLRQAGNIMFVGELFRKGLLRELIIHTKVLAGMLELDPNTIDKSTPEEIRATPVPETHNLELTVKLLKRIGHHLDTASDVSREKNNKYFIKIEHLAEEPQEAAPENERAVEPRVRFLLRDLVDLRRNGWEKRKGDLDKNRPKTIEEIHRDANREKQQLAQKTSEFMRRSGTLPSSPSNSASSPPAFKRSNPGTPASSMSPPPGGRGRASGQASPSESLSKSGDNWQVKGGGGRGGRGSGRGGDGGGRGDRDSGRGGGRGAPPSRFGGRATEAPSPSRGRGGGRGGSRFEDSPSRGGRQPQASPWKGKDAPLSPSNSGNSFGALGGDEGYDEDEDYEPEDTRGRLSMSKSTGVLPPITNKDAPKFVPRHLAVTGGAEGRREPSPSPSRSPLTTPDKYSRSAHASPGGDDDGHGPKVVVTKELIEERVGAFLEEYRDAQDVPGAFECFQELNSRWTGSEVVRQTILLVVEKEMKRQQLFYDLLLQFSKESTGLNTQDWLQGLKASLELADDLVIDIPKVLELMGQFLSFAMCSCDHLVSPQAIYELLLSIAHMNEANTGNAAKIAAFALQGVAKEKDLDAAKTIANVWNLKALLKDKDSTSTPQDDEENFKKFVSRTGLKDIVG